VQREINKNESIAPPGWCEGQKKEEKKREYYVCFFFFQKPVSSNGRNYCKTFAAKEKKEIWVVAKASPL
jgi:hypothetical protein